MAIIPCPDCGRDVSDGAPYCSECGYPVLERIAPAPRRARRAWPVVRIYRVALFLGIVGMWGGRYAGSGTALVLGIASFLIGAAVFTVSRFKSYREFEAE